MLVEMTTSTWFMSIFRMVHLAIIFMIHYYKVFQATSDRILSSGEEFSGLKYIKT